MWNIIHLRFEPENPSTILQEALEKDWEPFSVTRLLNPEKGEPCLVVWLKKEGTPI